MAGAGVGVLLHEAVVPARADAVDCGSHLVRARARARVGVGVRVRVDGGSHHRHAAHLPSGPG